MISQKGIYGLASGVITTMILQPLQNIKMALMIPPKDLATKGNILIQTINASKYIYCVDGWRGYYKGLMAGAMKAAFGCYIYFATLRKLQQFKDQGPLTNFFFSSTARVMSTLFTNPLSIIQTRFQLANFHEYASVRGAIKDIYRKEGFMSFFSGGLASCIKEGIFAGCYYMIYVQLKQFNFSKLPAGLLSGMISTCITHPFQIIRARLQVIGLTEKHKFSEHMIWKQFQILKQNGTWFKGIIPRLFKKPLANTLTFLIFQNIEDIKQNSKN